MGAVSGFLKALREPVLPPSKYRAVLRSTTAREVQASGAVDRDTSTVSGVAEQHVSMDEPIHVLRVASDV